MARIVDIAGRHWLLGMEWCSFETIPDREAINADAERLHADWYTLRISHVVVQAGFCLPIDTPHPHKLYSLASYIADQYPQPWLGTFKIADGLWWCIAIRDGFAILPEGDAIGDEAHIYAAREAYALYSDWTYVEGSIADLAALIAQVNSKPDQIKSLSKTRIGLTPLLLIGLSILAILGGAYYGYQQNQRREAEAAAAAIAEIRQQINTQSTIADNSRQLLKTPLPDQWLTACSQIMLNLPLSQFGWVPNQLSCEASKVVVKWTRQAGAVLAIRPEGELSANEEVLASYPLNLETSGIDNGAPLEAEKTALKNWAEAINLPVNFVPRSEPHAGKQLAVKFQMAISPFQISFNGLPGLRLTGIQSLGVNSAGWSVEGVLYGQ